MEGAILSTSSSTRFRAHLKNAANAICAKTLPKQRRSEGTASTTVQHHTYPRATTPKQVSMAFRIESPKCDKVQQPSPFDIQEHEPFFPVPKSSCNGTTQFNGNHTYPRSTPPKRAAISCRAESPKCDPTRQESPFDEQEHVPQVVPDVKSNSNGTNQLTGKLAREVASAWGCRVGAPGKPAPVDCIQSLFNDIELYPTKTQVFEMLVCARKCARRKSLTLTFGEFCLFAAELRRCSRQARQTPTKPESPIWSSDKEARDKDTTCKHVNGSEASPPPCEVFLGGSCNPTTWRSDIAIPMLTKMGITYFNPQVEDWSTELVEVEHRAKAAARALLFVLDSETRAVAASVEAAHLAAAPRDLLLVLRPYSRHQKVGNESLSDHEYVELSRARATLQEAVERRGLPAFTDIPAALSCARAVLRGARTHPRHSLGHTILRLKRAYDAAGGRNAMLFRTRAVEALREVTRAPLELVERCLPPAMEPVDFESFCAAVAELAADAGPTSEVARQEGNAFGRMAASFVRAFRTLRERLTPTPPTTPEYQTRSSTEAEAVADAGAGEARGEESPRENVRHAYNARLRACGRKLALFIPKNGGRAPADSPAEGAGSDAVLTPGTARRLERLPAMLGAPAHDVYLAGALQSNSSRPEEILRREGFTYVIPRANDYTRMFSAPARRSAPAHPESPRRDKKPRNTSDGDSRSHEGRSHDSRSHEAAEEDVEVRERSAREPSDRLSASDFYNVSEDLTPQPFKGTYDEDLLLGSRVLVFWLSAEAPCFAAMVLAAHYMGLRPNATVLIVQALDPAKATLYSEVAVKDYNRGRHYLTDLARRSGVPVFDNVDAAMACVVSRLKATHL